MRKSHKYGTPDFCSKCGQEFLHIYMKTPVVFTNCLDCRDQAAAKVKEEDLYDWVNLGYEERITRCREWESSFEYTGWASCAERFYKKYPFIFWQTSEGVESVQEPRPPHVFYDRQFCVWP